MRSSRKYIALATVLLAVRAASAQLSPNAPPDHPEPVAVGDQLAAFEVATRPCVDQARKSFPDVKRRFLEGLPQGHSLFVVTRLPIEPSTYEQAFVKVMHLEGDKIHGLIASRLIAVKALKIGDPYIVKEVDLVDWVISKPDGSEEGNCIGKYIDALQAAREKEKSPSK